MDNAQLIMLIGGGIGSLIIGGISKALKKDGAIPYEVPNELIPLINGVIFTLLFATFGGLGFTYAAMQAGMAAAYTGIATYEVSKLAGKKVAVGMLVLLAMLMPAPAHADEQPVRDKFTFRQHLPAYIGTNYSNSADWTKEATPYIRAQIAQAMTGNPITIGGLDIRPEASFVWRAMLWPVGADSSPIEENNYMPEGWVTINSAGANDMLVLVEEKIPGTDSTHVYEKLVYREDREGIWRGAAVGYMHQSTGTDSASGSWDRLGVRSAFGYTLLVGGQRVDVRGTVTAWYVLQTGSGTAGLLDYVNFGLWDDVGGEVQIGVNVPNLGRASGTFGLSYQNYELAVPLAAAWSIELFGQFHHGNFERMTNYRERPDSGIAGIAFWPSS